MSSMDAARNTPVNLIDVPGVLDAGLRIIRDTIRCPHCGWNQFKCQWRDFCKVCRKKFQPYNDTHGVVFPILVHQVCLRLRALRRAKGITQSQMARCVPCTRTYISKYERGYCRPTIDHLMRLAAVLGVDFLDLLDDNLDINTLAIRSAGRGMVEAKDEAFLAEMAAEVPRLGVHARLMILQAAREMSRKNAGI